MPESNSEKSSGNQIALPTNQLYATVANYFSNLANGNRNGDGEHSQVQKAFEIGSYFLSGCTAVTLSQCLGSPLYLINQDWYNAWIAMTKQSFGLLTTTLTQYWAPTVVRVSGDKSVRGQLIQTSNGGLLCNFPQRMILIANHQIYTDWLYLWWIAYCNGMHGRIFIVLKESLRKLPILGWGMRFAQFIFLKRNWEQDQARMAVHFQKLNKIDLPMWLLIFPEGTNLAESTRERSAKWAEKNGIDDLQHTLIPRSTGLRFTLQQMRQTVKYVYDCTIAYEGVPRGEYAQDIFTVRTAYIEGKPPKSVNMYWRRFAISSIPVDDPVAFEVWLRARWMEKDGLIEAYYRHGRFPADRGAHKTREGKIVRGAGHIETEIKANYWYEFLQIFAPVGLFALVLYMFYNALPKTYTKSLNRQNVIKQAQTLQRTRSSTQKEQRLTDSASNVPREQNPMLAKAMMIYDDLSQSSSVRKVVELPELTPKGFKNEMMKHQPAVDTIFTQKNALQDMRRKKTPARASVTPSQTSSKSASATSKGSSGGNHVVKAKKAPPQNPASKKAEGRKIDLPKASGTLGTLSKLPQQKVAPSTKSLSTTSHPSPAKPSAMKPPAAKVATKSAAPKLDVNVLNGVSTKAQKGLNTMKPKAPTSTKTAAN